MLLILQYQPDLHDRPWFSESSSDVAQTIWKRSQCLLSMQIKNQRVHHKNCRQIFALLFSHTIQPCRDKRFLPYKKQRTQLVISNDHHYMTTIVAPWAGKMNQIPRCDWLTERARWSYTASSGFVAWSRKIKDHFFGVLSHIINPLFTKLVRS